MIEGGSGWKSPTLYTKQLLKELKKKGPFGDDSADLRQLKALSDVAKPGMPCVPAGSPRIAFVSSISPFMKLAAIGDFILRMRIARLCRSTYHRYGHIRST